MNWEGQDSVREHPDMMSASEGGGGLWKSRRSKGGCVNCIVEISSKCGQGGEGVKKSENFADVINGSPLEKMDKKLSGRRPPGI